MPIIVLQIAFACEEFYLKNTFPQGKSISCFEKIRVGIDFFHNELLENFPRRNKQEQMPREHLNSPIFVPALTRNTFHGDKILSIFRAYLDIDFYS